MKTNNDGNIPTSVIVMAILGVILFITTLSSITIIGAGQRGVVTEFGAVTDRTMNEGLNFKKPFIQGVDKFDVKTLKIETQASASSKDLQIVTSTIALNFRVKAERVNYIRQTIGKQQDYVVKIIDPSIQESIKSTTAKFTAEELITKRPQVREEMKIALQEKLNNLGGSSFIAEDFNIINFDFSPEFNQAIEQKVTAEQQALKAERDLDRIKIEAQQKIESAKAEAESIRIQSEALNENPDILQLRAIEKWNGILPVYTGSGVVPFIDINKVSTNR